MKQSFLGFSLFFVLFFPGLAWAANSCGATYCTYDSNIMASETWIDGNTYVLTGDVNVTGSGVTLTIQPGAVVKLKTNTELKVFNSARIAAQGTADKNIFFISCKDQNTYTGVTNANTSAECSGAPSVNDYNAAIWIRADSGMTTDDNFSHLRIMNGKFGIVLDEDINAIRDSNFAIYKRVTGTINNRAILVNASSAIKIHNNQFSRVEASSRAIEFANTFSGSVYNNAFSVIDSSGGSYAIHNAANTAFSGAVYSNTFNTGDYFFYMTNGTVSGSIYDNNIMGIDTAAIFQLAGTFSGNIYKNNIPTASAGFQINGGTFSGNIFDNNFDTYNTNQKAIYGASTFSGSIYNNRFNNFTGAYGVYDAAISGIHSGSIYSNRFTNFSGAGFGIQSAGDNSVTASIFNNTFSNFGGTSTAIDGTTAITGNIQRNIFSNVVTALSGTLSGTVSHNAYFQVGTIGGTAANHGNDENSNTGFTSDPFIADNSDRNFLLNTAAAGGEQLVNAGNANTDSFYQARTTRLSNKLDTGAIDMGYHYDQNAPYAVVVRPSDSNTLSGTQSIDFNVESGFGAASGITTTLARSATQSGGTNLVSQALSSYSCSAGPVFVCAYAWDTTSSPDGNYFIVLTASDSNGSGADASDNNFQVLQDSAAPTTSADYNAAWQNVDANVVLTCSDGSGSGCSVTKYRLDTSSGTTVSLGSWTTFDSNILISSDGNWAIDFNSTDVRGNIESTNRIYVLIDKSLPTLSLTITSLTVTGLSAVFSYSGSATSGIKKYWISTDGGSTYADNGTNTSYTFSIDPNVRLPYRHRVYVKATNNADVNTASASFDVMFESASGSPDNKCGNNLCDGKETAATCPKDCPAVCGDRACTHTENVDNCPNDCIVGCGNRICEANETLQSCPVDCGSEGILQETRLNATQSSPSSIDGLESFLESIGIVDRADAERALKGISVKRFFVRQLVAGTLGVREQTKVVLVITNQTDAPFKNILIAERVPSLVLSDVSEVSSVFPFDLFSGSGAVVFTVPGLFANQTIVLDYVLASGLSESQAALFDLPFAFSVTDATVEEVEQTKCSADLDCSQNNRCALNRCIRNSCYAVNFPEGEACDIGSVCRRGVCTSVVSAYRLPEGIDWLLVATAVVIIALLGVIGREYFKKEEPEFK